MSNITPVPPKALVTRAWNDLAPKLLAFLTGGTAATALVAVLAKYFDIVLDPALAGVIVVVAGTILGYFVKDKAPIEAGTATAGTASDISSLPNEKPSDTAAAPVAASVADVPADPAPTTPVEAPADPAAPLTAIVTSDPVPADPANVQ